MTTAPIQMLRNRGLLGAFLLLTGCDIDLGRAPDPKFNPSGLYDLEATSVTFHPSVVKVGSEVIFNQVITNTGKDDIPPRYYEVELYVDGKLVSFDRATKTIFAGCNTKYGMAPGYFHWQPTAPGTYQFRLLVDVKNTLPETNETNNEFSGTVVVVP